VGWRTDCRLPANVGNMLRQTNFIIDARRASLWKWSNAWKSGAFRRKVRGRARWPSKDRDGGSMVWLHSTPAKAVQVVHSSSMNLA
jgi:hypothetical protein